MAELISILEQDGGEIIFAATDELLRIGPLIPDDQVTRLVKLSESGDPDWRKHHATRVLKAKWASTEVVDNPDVATAAKEILKSQ